MGCSQSPVLFREESTTVSPRDPISFRAPMTHYLSPRTPTIQSLVLALPLPLDPLVTRSTLDPCGGELLLISRKPLWLPCSLVVCALSFQTQGARWFVIFAGGVLGVSAALLWSAQGAIMMSYPLEKDKGKAFGVFWAIFQFGSFIGSIIALAINIRSEKLSSVSTATYLVGFCRLFSLFICTSSFPP